MGPITVAKLVVVNTNTHKVLLLRRSSSDSRRPLQWDLPGGRVEADELIEEGAVRECKEEAGIVLKPHALKLISTLNGTVNKGKIWVNWLFFAAQTATDEVVLSNEHDDSKWCSLEEALDSLQYDRHIKIIQQIIDHHLLGDWV